MAGESQTGIRVFITPIKVSSIKRLRKSAFKDETQRIYHLLTESQSDRDLRQAAEWIRQHGGTVRARDLVSGRRDIIDVEQADDLLQRLVNAGFGSWRMVASGERGGRPTMEFSLFHAD